ncbi:hypothetical protein FLL45_10065 [Aliikangiella marina]|uniref:Uncharacterized protein n=1 Tax=Aliikangiella marina TaxID=1712262 RepID=A0A545TDK1_9GAMM|nr:hypothetical protein [Aliikangiella marina]TQV75271.1 hypothetical protein FLL45_10065 [Aliikangiella marina]
MKKLIGLISILLIVGIALLWSFSQTRLEQNGLESDESFDKRAKESVKQANLLEQKETKPATEISKTQAKEIEPIETVGAEISGEFNGISRPSTVAKEILDKAGVLPKDLQGEAYVEFDLEALRQLEVGDTFNLEIPQTSEMFSAEVTKTNIFDNGDKSVFGRLVGSDGNLHTTVLTVGADALYGQFTTTSGNYVFESLGQHGWLAAKRDLYRNHVEFEAVEMGASANGSHQFAADKKQ